MENGAGFALKVSDPRSGREMVLPLSENQTLRIGRAPQNEVAVSWDREISREHAQLRMENGNATVSCLPKARNPILIAGGQTRELLLTDKQQFQIGQTLFEYLAPGIALEETMGPDDDDDAEIFGLKSGDLSKFEFGDTQKQMQLLCDLPKMIANAESEAELGHMLAGLLLDAIPEAVAVAVANYEQPEAERLKASELDDSQLINPAMMRVRTRDDYQGRFMPSRRLVGRSLKRQESTIHVWGARDESGRFTMSDSLSWAFCVPVPGESSSGWCLYCAGEGGKDGAVFVTADTLEPDVRFAQLLAQFIGSIRQVRVLQDQKTQLSSFFSPKVIENLTGGGDALAPSEKDITVLFCDVRGFSRKSEMHQDDLHYLLECVKAALGAMTQGILAHDGAIADFQGDAALGFWGWPVGLEDGAVPAALAALEIQHTFAHSEGNELLEGFSVGLGIAHGNAIAGQIGTAQQAKIGVFGPVVNQGARLESMTKQYGVSICIDEKTAEFVKGYLGKMQARVRRLARVRPKGMDTPITVNELLNGANDSDVSDQQIENFEAALDLVIEGKWTEAIAALKACPEEGPVTFLLERMEEENNTPPADWDGAFSLANK
jgi:adenylate cyclase